MKRFEVFHFQFANVMMLTGMLLLEFQNINHSICLKQNICQ